MATNNSSNASIGCHTTTNPAKNTRIMRNFALVWLDSNIDEANSDCQNTIVALRRIVNTIHTFTDWPACFTHISEIKNARVFMVVSGALGQGILPDAQLLSQIEAIYVFCSNREWHERWAKNWSKIEGVFTDIGSLSKALEQAARQCDQDSISMSFMPITTEMRLDGLNQLDSSFMYTQLLKEILIDFDYHEHALKDLTDRCRGNYTNNPEELRAITEFEQKYCEQASIWWYTRECFMYKMLNGALRNLEVDVIILFGFFIRDLHRQIKQLHANQYGSTERSRFVVYRGQRMPNADFDKLRQTLGGLIAFNELLSTSHDYTVSMRFAHPALDNPDFVGVIYVMNINPSIATVHFAEVTHFSSAEDEKEILFSMHAIFRIERIVRIQGNRRLWEVHLRLTGDSDERLNRMAEYLREENEGQTGAQRLGTMLIKLGEFDQARNVFQALLKTTAKERNKGVLYYQVGRVENCSSNYREALSFYEKSLSIYHRERTTIHPDLAALYVDIGLVHANMKKYTEALSFYERSLKIYKETLPSNHPDLATTYNNIGLVHDSLGNYSEALRFYQESLHIYQATLPENHPNIAMSQSNIGSVYYHMGHHSKALPFYQRSLETKQKVLPKSHPSLSTSYHNLGFVHDNLHEHSNALEFFEKSLDIDKKVLPSDHPDLATSYLNIAKMHEKRTDYAKALPFYEESLEICQKILPANDRQILALYGSIGSTSEHMGDDVKALSFYEKKHEALQSSALPSQTDPVPLYNHKRFRTTTNTRSADSEVSQVSRLRQAPPPPDLATSYGDMGLVYYRIGEYSKACRFFERAISIGRSTLPSNHPNLHLWKKNLDRVRKEL